MKEGIQHPTAEMKEALRGRMVHVFHDFDHFLGGFKSLAYFSPRDLIISQWAEMAGYTIAELRDAATAWRTNAECRNGIDAQMLKMMHDLERTVASWRNMTGYRRQPLDVRAVQKYTNEKEIISYVSGTLSDLDLFNVHSNRDSGTLSFSSFFLDAVGHRVHINMQVRLKYGGKLSTYLKFPYYEESDPTQLDIERLLGSGLCYLLEIDRPRQMQWIADCGKDAFPNLEAYLCLVGAVCEYLRSDSQRM